MNKPHKFGSKTCRKYNCQIIWRKVDSTVLWIVLNGRFGTVLCAANIKMEKVKNEDM